MNFSWLVMFKIIYKERTAIGWVLVVIKTIQEILWKKSLKARLQKLLAVKIRQRSLESSSYLFLGENLDYTSSDDGESQEFEGKD